MADITLSWQANPAQEYVDNYKVYSTKDGGMQQLVAEVPDTAVTLTDLESGNYVFNVAAENIAGVGPQSDNAVGPGLPSKVVGLQIEVI